MPGPQHCGCQTLSLCQEAVFNVRPGWESIDWVQLCFSVQKPVWWVALELGVGSPRLAGADLHSGAALHSLSEMILYFYLGGCGIFFKLSSNQERTMKDFVLVKGIIVTP